MAGKTGTAQKQPREAKNYLVSFIGYAPAYDPQVLVYVVLDTPNLPGEEQAHSRFASEISAKIMAEILPYMNVFPDTETGLQEDEDLAGREEGITSGDPSESQEGQEGAGEGGESEAPTETWASFDDEFIDSGEEDYNYPDSMPGGLTAPQESPGMPESTNAAESTGGGMTESSEGSRE